MRPAIPKEAQTVKWWKELKPSTAEPKAINKPPDQLGGVYWQNMRTGERYWQDGTKAPRDRILDLILRDRRRKRGYLKNWNTPMIDMPCRVIN